MSISFEYMFITISGTSQVSSLELTFADFIKKFSAESSARNKDQELVGRFLNIEYFIGY